ncbi:MULTISPECIES: hypothetical protein [Rhodococcus]|jgi:hypothetical protein|uniref:Uncharacterized protein n=1 Tax=Rhodococcus jostii (strain RHA1) TaxID=101510 RepID=Q0S0A0_RHOJR|nr:MULTISPECIES: hypothetical protein [Rhodococcus]ABG99036.1 conserved hypothetical protein [Rhodococcus jostii RHA1]
MMLANACELYRDAGFIGQPAAAVTSLAFVIAGLAVVARRPHSAPIVTYGLLVIAVGAGSLVAHGPNPPWQAYAHDVPIATLLAFIAVDAASDRLGRRLSPVWWLVVPVVMIPAVAAGPTASTAAQAILAAVAVGLGLERARVRPQLRRTTIVAALLLASGALLGTGSVLQGHALWHVLAAAGLWRLAPTIGSTADTVAARRSQTGTNGDFRRPRS